MLTIIIIKIGMEYVYSSSTQKGKYTTAIFILKGKNRALEQSKKTDRKYRYMYKLRVFTFQIIKVY